LSETVRCGVCGFLLYWGEAIKDRLYMRFSEEKLLDKYGNVCPSCGSRLDVNSVKITIKP
jgi:DNA-directed RNA polymerase subunit RPC12/RpoP